MSWEEKKKQVQKQMSLFSQMLYFSSILNETVSNLMV